MAAELESVASAMDVVVGELHQMGAEVAEGAGRRVLPTLNSAHLKPDYAGLCRGTRWMPKRGMSR